MSAHLVCHFATPVSAHPVYHHGVRWPTAPVRASHGLPCCEEQRILHNGGLRIMVHHFGAAKPPDDSMRGSGALEPHAGMGTAPATGASMVYSEGLLMAPSVTYPCAIRSSNRPGVATTISTPLFIARCCGNWPTPPKITVCVTCRNRP